MRATRILAVVLVLGVTAALGVGCGGGAASSKCTAACRPTGLCAGKAPDDCLQDCAAALDGLDAACADCVAEHTGWKGVECQGGCLCGFGPGDSECGCGSGSNCSSADNKCTGYDIGEVSDSDCKDVCATR